jgi:hypothetical protein
LVQSHVIVIITLVPSRVIVVASLFMSRHVATTVIKSDVIIASLIFIQFSVDCWAVNISAALKTSWFGRFGSPIVGTARDGCEQPILWIALVGFARVCLFIPLGWSSSLPAVLGVSPVG